MAVRDRDPLDTIDLLRRLVAFDSVSRSSNVPMADFLADLLDRPGTVLARCGYTDGDGVEKTNLLARLGPPPDAAARAGLVLSGHMDVVPADEPEWESDPFELTERESPDGPRLHGRGSADMKGFLALATRAALRLDPDDLTAPLVLVFTCDEELGTVGARYLHDHWNEVEPEIGPLPSAAVIGEPTELEVVRLHKGHLKFRVTLHGKSAHSGYPHLGRNAIEIGGRVIASLTTLRRELETERPPHGEHFPEVPYVALNQGTIHGGAAVNVVPDRCVIEGGARILPGMGSAELIERLERAVSRAAAPGEATFENLGESPPLQVAEEATVHRALCEATGRKGGGSVAFATDGGWLQRLGLDPVIWGPGSIEVAHRPDEYVPLEQLRDAGEPLERMIRRFCRGAS
jgi:acetylornithine deacetylase